MNTIQPQDFASEEQIARNHDRVRGLRDRSTQLFAVEELTLQGELMRQAPAPTAVVTVKPSDQLEMFA